jgi:hypothetical protein
VAQSPEWKRLQPQPAERVWSDDYSNVLGVLKWGADDSVRAQPKENDATAESLGL